MISFVNPVEQTGKEAPSGEVASVKSCDNYMWEYNLALLLTVSLVLCPLDPFCFLGIEFIDYKARRDHVVLQSDIWHNIGHRTSLN